MSKSKREHTTISIPKVLYERIKGLIVQVGCPSVSEYARQAMVEKEKYDRDMLLREEED